MPGIISWLLSFFFNRQATIPQCTWNTISGSWDILYEQILVEGVLTDFYYLRTQAAPAVLQVGNGISGQQQAFVQVDIATHASTDTATVYLAYTDANNYVSASFRFGLVGHIDLAVVSAGAAVGFARLDSPYATVGAFHTCTLCINESKTILFANCPDMFGDVVPIPELSLVIPNTLAFYGITGLGACLGAETVASAEGIYFDDFQLEAVGIYHGVFCRHCGDSTHGAGECGCLEGAYDEMTLVADLITDGTCLDCDLWNGTWVLQRLPSAPMAGINQENVIWHPECAWGIDVTAAPNACGYNNGYWIMQTYLLTLGQETGTVRFWIASAWAAVGDKPLAPWIASGLDQDRPVTDAAYRPLSWLVYGIAPHSEIEGLPVQCFFQAALDTTALGTTCGTAGLVTVTP